MKAAASKSDSQRRPPVNSRAGATVRASWWIPATIAVLTAVAFLPVLYNEFVDWDDHDNLLANPNYRGLSWNHLGWMFTTFHMSLYRPVTWMTLGLDYLAWGVNPAGYHLTSLLFHSANAMLFYFVAQRLLRLALPVLEVAHLRLGGAFAALVFSLHPLRVEAVAWASGRENVVSGFFFMLAVLCYLNATAPAAHGARRWHWMGASWAVAALSLLSKASGMPLPLALLVLDVYPLRRLDGDPRKWLRPEYRSILWEKVPYLLMAVAVGAAAVLAKQQEQAVHSLAKYTLVVRIAESFYGLAFYLGKTLLPVGLSPLYQLPVQPDPWSWRFSISAITVVALTILLLLIRRRLPGGLAAWAFYGLMIAPVLGIVQYGPQIAADRYTYLPCLGWAVLAGAGVLALGWTIRGRAIGPPAWRRAGPRLLCSGLLVLVIFGLATLTWKQSQVWHDSVRLWRHALAVDPQSSFAHHMLAIALYNRGKNHEAIEHYRQSVRLNPDFVQAHYNLAGYLVKQGNYSEAAFHYHRAIEIDPGGPARAYYALANALAKQGLIAESIKYFQIGLKKNPKDAAAHNTLGNLFAMKGDIAQAVDNYRRAAQLDPAAGEPYFNLGNLAARQNQIDQAIVYFQQALKLDPNHAPAHNNLGRLLAAQGKLDEAVYHFRQALRVDPKFAPAQESLIAALSQQSKRAEAIRRYP